jgi:hypothetical protein
MEAYASELLALPDEVLFTHRGCHVFALALKERFQYPLLWVREECGKHDHVASAPEEGRLVDLFGWFSYREYIRAEMLDELGIRFLPIQAQQVERRFIFAPGKGYYAHPDFFIPATERARAWIAKYREYFDGTEKAAIPGFERAKKASDQAVDAIITFQKPV